MTERPTFNDLPYEMRIEILARLSWREQLAVRRVSRRWREAVDACLARRRELTISKADIMETRLGNEELLNLLHNMPALRRLCVFDCSEEDMERANYTGPISIGIFYPHTEQVERFCNSCQELQEVNLECILNDFGVETLLRRLPALRSLSLSNLALDTGDCLSLIPTELQSLSLPEIGLLDYTSLRHLLRCQQLRQLDLSGGTMEESEQLAKMVSACSQLERLSVAGCSELTLDWLPQLMHCPQLRELDISGLETKFTSGMTSPDFSSILTTCSQLERLRVAEMGDPMATLPSSSLPCLTHLDLSDTLTDDDTFERLAGILPNLRDIRLQRCDKLTVGGLASGLAQLTNLQVLDLRGTRAFTGFDDRLSSVSDLPLKAFAYDRHTFASYMATLMRRCPTLTVFSPGFSRADQILRLAEKVAEDPKLENRDIVLLAKRSLYVNTHISLPRNVRLAFSGEEQWEELAGWKWWTFCRCAGHQECGVRKLLADL